MDAPFLHPTSFTAAQHAVHYTFGMPRKKPKATEAEIHAIIVRDAKTRIGCHDFDPQFTLYRVPDDPSQWRANWGLWQITNFEEWEPGCPEAFMEAIQRTRMKFDIAWP